MSHISYKKAEINDVLRISMLFKQVYMETYAIEGISHELANFAHKRFSPELIEQTIIKNPEQLIIAFYKDNPIGVAEVIQESTCRLRKTVAPELSKLYVLERFYGKAIGYGLLQKVEKEVIRKGYSELWLEVYIHNFKGIAFYKRQQYEEIGQVDFPMENNVYKNIVMRKILI